LKSFEKKEKINKLFDNGDEKLKVEKRSLKMIMFV